LEVIRDLTWVDVLDPGYELGGGGATFSARGLLRDVFP
jgi:hypothetical protein